MEPVTAAWTLESILTPTTITAIFAALAALISGFIAWRQHVWNKRIQLASVRPYITDFLLREFTKNEISFCLMNKGLGPAKLKRFVVTWDGASIGVEKLELRIKEALTDNFSINVSELSGLSALSVNDEIELISYRFIGDGKVTVRDSADFVRLTATLIDKLRVEIEYTSFLDDETFIYRTKPIESFLNEFESYE